jgi:hypothetical protein
MTLVERLRDAEHRGAALHGEDLIAAADRIEQLEAALREIARQHTLEEMAPEDYCDGDFEGAYDHMVKIARAVLEPKPPTPANDDPEEIDTDNIGGLH